MYKHHYKTTITQFNRIMLDERCPFNVKLNGHIPMIGSANCALDCKHIISYSNDEHWVVCKLHTNKNRQDKFKKLLYG